jgi:hypothetical protein
MSKPVLTVIFCETFSYNSCLPFLVRRILVFFPDCSCLTFFVYSNNSCHWSWSTVLADCFCLPVFVFLFLSNSSIFYLTIPACLTVLADYSCLPVFVYQFFFIWLFLPAWLLLLTVLADCSCLPVLCNSSFLSYSSCLPGCSCWLLTILADCSCLPVFV